MKKYIAVAILTAVVLFAFALQACSSLPIAKARLDYYETAITALGVEIVGIANDFETLANDAKAALEALETAPTPEQMQPYVDRFTGLRDRFITWLNRVGEVWREAKAELGSAHDIIDRLINFAESDRATKTVGYIVQLYGLLK